MRVREMIRLHLAVHNLQQDAVAHEIGMGKTTFSRFLNSNRTPDGHSIARIIAWLFEEPPAEETAGDPTEDPAEDP